MPYPPSRHVSIGQLKMPPEGQVRLECSCQQPATCGSQPPRYAAALLTPCSVGPLALPAEGQIRFGQLKCSCQQPALGSGRSIQEAVLLTAHASSLLQSMCFMQQQLVRQGGVDARRNRRTSRRGWQGQGPVLAVQHADESRLVASAAQVEEGEGQRARHDTQGWR